MGRERLSCLVDGRADLPPDPGNYDPVAEGEAQGTELMPGETTEQYTERQKRLQEMARQRMREKFGDGQMAGISSNGSGTNTQTDAFDFDFDFGGLTANVSAVSANAAGAARKVGGAVGGTVTNVKNFIRGSVIENTELHDTIRGTVSGVVTDTAGALSSLRKTVGEGEVIESLRRNVVAEEGSAVRKGWGWTVGAIGGLIDNPGKTVGGLWEKANEKFTELVGDPEVVEEAAAPRCRQGHRLFTAVRPTAQCVECGANGTRYCCAEGEYDVCTKCFEAGLTRGGSRASGSGQNGGATADEIAAAAKELGMTLSGEPSGSSSRPSHPKEQPSEPTASVPQLSVPKAKEKAKITSPDDFFSEFGV